MSNRILDSTEANGGLAALNSQRSILEALKLNCFFADFADSVLEKLTATIEVLRLNAGSVILSNEQTSQAIYLVESGEVGFFSVDQAGNGGEIRGSVGPRGYFGESMVLERERRRDPNFQSVVRCLADCVILKVPGDVFRRLLPGGAQLLARNLLRHASGKTANAAYQRLQNRLQAEREQRLSTLAAWFLTDLAPLVGAVSIRASGDITEPEHVVSLQQDAAKLVAQLEAFGHLCGVPVTPCNLESIDVRSWWHGIASELETMLAGRGFRLDAYVQSAEVLVDVRLLTDSVRMLFARVANIASSGCHVEWRVGAGAGQVEFRISFAQECFSDFAAAHLFDPLSSPDVIRLAGLAIANTRAAFERMGGGMRLDGPTAHRLGLLMTLPSNA